MMPSVLIMTPAQRGSTKGNRITAERWAKLLRELGHDVVIASEVVDGEFDCLFTLHATHSFSVIKDFRNRFPCHPIVLCITGTDLHLDLAGHHGDHAMSHAKFAIDHCDHLILLEPSSTKRLPENVRSKIHVIHQSAVPVRQTPDQLIDTWEVCLIGHLRDAKDPFLTACAARLLPPGSRIRISHLGAVLEDGMQQQAESEMASNLRYHWLGSRPHDETQQILARSRLMVLSSKIEGAPSVISEAIVNDVPILATNIPAVIGLLGADYPGLFPVGDHKKLAQHLDRAEHDSKFIAELLEWTSRLKHQFAPESERQRLKHLMSIL